MVAATPDSSGSTSVTRIGFMQGRLSPPVGDRIQAFPWVHWRDEFPAARRLGFTLMEWTVDAARLRENPIMTRAGQDEIRSLEDTFGVRVRSLTADCVMEAPFYKASEGERERVRRLDDLKALLDACAESGIVLVVIPLVDDGRLVTDAEEDALRQELLPLTPVLRDSGVRVVFESDFPPPRLRAFIDTFPPEAYGINYDTGNSAAVGYDPREEIERYGTRIWNVHVKDRRRGGTTVPLGTGAADLPMVFNMLVGCGYAGKYILQTARAADGNHAAALQRYRDMVASLLAGANGS